MAARRGQKLKLLYIIDILKKETDEEHPISANEICDKLSALGVDAERKAIYDDIEQLTEYGLDIIKTRVPRRGYFLASREFELPEIYLLTDAVRAAKFISTKKTRELVSKLDNMLSCYQSKRREKRIYFDVSDKCSNEEIFYNIDSISRAIENGKKIEFRYSVRTLGEGREIGTVQKTRQLNPYAMTWQDDHYYLIGNYDKYDNLVHLRIDRMHSVNETELPVRPFSEVSEYEDYFDISDYTGKLFSMFGGEDDEIELKCSKEILEQIADRFTDRIFIKNVTETHFCFSFKAAISPALVTWIMNYGDRAEVLYPPALRNMIARRAESILNIYEKEE